jgi:hypothetical protein
MLPEVTKDTIKKVRFPVFKLRSDELRFYKNILYCEDKIVDDKSVEGSSLGVRRLRVNSKELYPLRDCAFDFLSMIRAGYKHFIDSNGKAFTYRKTKSCKIRSYRIDRVEHKDHYSTLKVKGLSKVFILPRPPPAGYFWANIIFFDRFPWEVLSFSEEKQPEKRRLI